MAKTREFRQIKKIIIHCSDSDRPEHDNIETIKKWHLERGFEDIGYHFYVNKKGNIYKGRPLYLVGAHCEGHNTESVGICFGGKENFTEEQMKTGMILILDLIDVLGIKATLPQIEKYVYPHNYFNEHKTCPNFPIKNLFKYCNRELISHKMSSEMKFT